MDSKVKVLAHWTSKGTAVAWDEQLEDPALPQWVTAPLFPPVRICEDEWPVVAHGSYRDHNGCMYKSQATRWWRMDMRVRQHADGRAIVYGTYNYSSAFPGELDFVARAGLMLDKDADLVASIRTVGSALTRAVHRAGRDYNTHIADAVRDCIADLPAIELE